MAELQLDTLESKGLIRVAVIQPELEYLFRHALVQDAAYESLLKQERRALHRLVGGALEQLYPERHGELAAVLARHFEQAGEPDKAIAYLLEAARFALERNALVEAFDMFSRALVLLPAPAADDPPEQRHRRLVIELGRLKAGFSFIDERQLLEMLPGLVEQADATDDLRLAAEVHVHVAFLRSFRGERYESSPQLRHSLDRVTEIARELDDPLIDALPKSLLGLFQVFVGELESGVATLREVSPLLAQKHDFIGSSFALVSLAIGLARLGRFDEAAEAAQRATEVAEQGDVIAKLDSLIGESVVRSVRGDLEGAVPIALKCTQLAEQTGAAACLVSSSFFLGDAYMRQGQFADAKIAFERGSSLADVTDQNFFRPSISAYLRSTMASLGGGPPNVQSFDAALAETRRVGDRWGETNVIWKRAETEAKRPDGDRAQALADFAAAAAAFAAMGGRPFQARVLRDWGNALRATGQAEEGDARLREALALFDEMGITREADEVRRELA